jgi:hypothetical protein
MMMDRDVVGEVRLCVDKSRVHAFWQPADGSSRAFLGSIDLATYNNHLHIRTLFIELASEVMINRTRAAGSSIPTRTREPPPASFRYFPDFT